MLWIMLIFLVVILGELQQVCESAARLFKWGTHFDWVLPDWCTFFHHYLVHSSVLVSLVYWYCWFVDKVVMWTAETIHRNLQRFSNDEPSESQPNVEHLCRSKLVKLKLRDRGERSHFSFQIYWYTLAAELFWDALYYASWIHYKA